MILIVKSILDLLPRFTAMSGVVMLAALLAACGQKGPLYLPAKPQPVQTAPAQPAQSTSDQDTTGPASK